MANLIAMLVAAPGGLWESIIFHFNGFIENYALAIIVLTICIKLITLPTDFFNRKTSLKMTEVQEKLKPKMEEIQRRYPDRMVQNQKLSELYQKEGFNPGRSCLVMFVVMIISIAIFVSLFAGLNNFAAYKVTNQYESLKNAYIQEYVMSERGITEEQFKNLEFTEDEIGNYIIKISEEGTEDEILAKTQVANNSVKERYTKERESFLWIKNVWLADSPLKSEIPSFEEYYKLSKLELKSEEKLAYEKQYNTVMSQLKKDSGVNGYFILAVLAGASAFLYQYLILKSNKKKKGQELAAGSQGKTMLIVLPAIMLVFTLGYNSIFALYIITSQLFGMATAPIIAKVINRQQ